ncbi:MAG TPA: response regulator, partial [Bryobacteraceae bacterium]|nr:response regulator [Bryobacteraceae bacterium]
MFSAETVPTILNVDDHEICRYAISRLLEQSNFRVREAATGAEALQTARREQPDLVLLDIHLPDIDGYEVCRRLKAEPATARIPVVHISATYLSGSDRARGLEAGADGYLTEPVEPEVLIATIRAILRARRAEESARNTAVEWQATFDAISDGVAVVDAAGRIQRSNAALARLLGRPGAELTGGLCYRLWEEADERKFPFFRALENGRRETVEWEHGLRLLSITVDPIFELEGKTAGAVCILSDITETRRLEEQFRESQKFETIGTLAAGVAHDYNNLLTSIMGNASLALGDQPEGSPVRERLQEVVRASQRAADLTRQLLAYSGKGRHFLQKADLSDLVRNTQKLIEAAVPKKIRLEYDLGSRLSIEADINQIQQALLNLVSNAAEAIGEATGQITVRTGAGEDGKVFLEVRDTGCGMDPATRSRIFDPFFTTKFTG